MVAFVAFVDVPGVVVELGRIVSEVVRSGGASGAGIFPFGFGGSGDGVGNRVAGSFGGADNFSAQDIEIVAPDFVGIPGDFVFAHPKGGDLDFMLWAFAVEAVGFVGGAAH